jgi:N-carbamoylputrescine amidase
MSTNTIRLGLVQMPGLLAKQENILRAEAGIRDCVSQGAQVVCLQELVHTLYFCQREEYEHFELAEAKDGPTVKHFEALASELRVVLVVPFFERRASGIYHNSAAVIDADGTNLGLYRKMHIPDDPGFMEKFYFTPGDLGFKSFQTKHGRIGVLICWDQWYPEAARLTALSGADVLLYPTAIGWDPNDAEERNRYAQAWQTSMRAHAIANGIYVAAINRCGQEGDISFWGRSFVANPMGEIIAEATGGASANLVVDCDLALAEQTRREWPFFRDRRIDAYDDIKTRFIDAE